MLDPGAVLYYTLGCAQQCHAPLRTGATAAVNAPTGLQAHLFFLEIIDSVNNYGLHLITMDEGGCGLLVAFTVLECKDADAASTFPREMLHANPQVPPGRNHDDRHGWRSRPRRRHTKSPPRGHSLPGWAPLRDSPPGVWTSC